MMPMQGNEIAAFPVSVQGWTLAPEAETHTPENLYEYIDGAAELYLSYGFEKLYTRRYRRADQPEITVDLFDMGGSGNAFGIFAHSQESPGKEVGRDSEYLDGLLRFWQGRYYLSLLCSPETAEARPALLELGRRLAENLPPAAGRPRSLSLLPLPGLLDGTIRYFHHPAWQNTYVFVSAENILEIGPGCEAILAKYEQGAERPVVLLVHYPDRDHAERAFAGLRNKFHLPAAGGEAVRLADEKYFSAALENEVLAAVWHGGGPDPARRLLALLRENIASFEK